MSDTNYALVAMGANLPIHGVSPVQTLLDAMRAIVTPQLAVKAASRSFKTPCFPAGAGPDYVNAAVVLAVDARLGPADVLAHLHDIEARFGRTRDTRWGMRTLDLDLLAFGDQVVPDGDTQTRWRDLVPQEQARLAPDSLILPHPRLQDRAFVLVPLADVAPDWVHPILKRTVVQMLADLPAADRDVVQPLG
jgi:2-amino-4-hydroxy-6-hydroxymethyldihydropteridine diphosphokinase